MNRKNFLISLTAVALTGISAVTIAHAGEAVMKTTPEKAKKILVVYYSWSGNTRALAEKIRIGTNAKIFEVLPSKPYPKEYRKCVDQAKEEIAKKFRPELKSVPEDLASYDTIFVGSPNWWGTYAPPIATLLDNPAFAGKTIVPFFTHGGGGMQNCESDMKKQCAKSTFLKAFTLSGSAADSSSTQKRVDSWLKEIGVVK